MNKDKPPKKIHVKDRHSYGLDFMVECNIEGLRPMYEMTYMGRNYLYCYAREDKSFHCLGEIKGVEAKSI